MMKKSYVWALLASMFMVGCSQNDDLPENPGEDQKVEKELSYIAINVNATPNAGGRAVADGGFTYGTADENKVRDAYFFFFKVDGNPFVVNGYLPETGTGNASAAGENWVKYTFTDAGQNQAGTSNVERKMEAVLTLAKMKDSHPTYMVVVLGGQPVNTTAISLTDLRQMLINDYKNPDDYFIMSNSVYSDGTNGIYATALTKGNFATSPDAAKASPVNVYVERVAARVGVGLNATKVVSGTNRFRVQNGGADQTITIHGESTPTTVYAEIFGWDINTTINHSYLMKDIAGFSTWSSDLGFTWSEANNFRSYWENTPHRTSDPVTTYDRTFDFNEFNDLAVKDYCLGNTNDTHKTKVIVRAQLQKEDGTPLNIASWLGNYYKFDDLKGIVAQSLSAGGTTLYYRHNDSEAWTLINQKVGGTVPGLGYIALLRGDGDTEDEGADYYKATFTLDPSGNALQWSFDGTSALTDIPGATVAQQVAAKLQSLAPAKIWTNGHTYYFLNIEHLGNGSSKRNYGVVRNHAYEIIVDGIVGLGTPVYVTETGTDFPEIPDPVIPDETETYLAAKINILSWALVSNNVILGQ